MKKSEIRMVFFVRTDLKMTKGKMCAQVGHAVEYAVYKQMRSIPTQTFLEWINNDSIKICLKVNSEEELLEFYNLGLTKEFDTNLVVDKGYTQFNNVPTNTVVSWGPLFKTQHENLTSDLKLL